MNLMKYFRVFDLNVVSLLRLDCTVPSAWTLQHTILVYSLLPFIVLIALSISFTYASNRVRMMHGRTKRPESSREQRDKMKTKQIELDKKNRKKVKKNMKNASEREDENSDEEEMKSHIDKDKGEGKTKSGWTRSIDEE